MWLAKLNKLVAATNQEVAGKLFSIDTAYITAQKSERQLYKKKAKHLDWAKGYAYINIHTCACMHTYSVTYDMHATEIGQKYIYDYV